MKVNKMKKWLVIVVISLSPIAVWNIGFFNRVYSEYGKFIVDDSNITITNFGNIIYILTLIGLVMLFKQNKKLVNIVSDNNNVLNIIVDLIIDVDSKIDMKTKYDIHDTINKNLSIMKEMGEHDD